MPSQQARSALLPHVLPGGQVAAGMALGMVTDQISQVVGFVAGAGIVAAAGVHFTLALDASTFVVSAALVARRVKVRPAPPWEGGIGRRTPWTGAKQGISLIVRDPVARLLVLLAGWPACTSCQKAWPPRIRTRYTKGLPPSGC